MAINERQRNMKEDCKIWLRFFAAKEPQKEYGGSSLWGKDSKNKSEAVHHSCLCFFFQTASGLPYRRAATIPATANSMLPDLSARSAPELVSVAAVAVPAAVPLVAVPVLSEPAALLVAVALVVLVLVVVVPVFLAAAGVDEGYWLA